MNAVILEQNPRTAKHHHVLSSRPALCTFPAQEPISTKAAWVSARLLIALGAAQVTWCICLCLTCGTKKHLEGFGAAQSPRVLFWEGLCEAQWGRGCELCVLVVSCRHQGLGRASCSEAVPAVSQDATGSFYACSACSQFRPSHICWNVNQTLWETGKSLVLKFAIK